MKSLSSDAKYLEQTDLTESFGIRIMQYIFFDIIKKKNHYRKHVFNIAFHPSYLQKQSFTGKEIGSKKE